MKEKTDAADKIRAAQRELEIAKSALELFEKHASNFSEDDEIMMREQCAYRVMFAAMKLQMAENDARRDIENLKTRNGARGDSDEIH